MSDSSEDETKKKVVEMPVSSDSSEEDVLDNKEGTILFLNAFGRMMYLT